MTRTARQKAIRREKRGLPPTSPACPHPEKRVYSTELAVTNALRSSKRCGRPIRIYKCPCGGFHLTKQKQKRS